MDYKIKYHDALERARDLMTNQNPSAFDKHLIEIIFPELAESEDERVRKALKQGFFEYGNSFTTFGGIQVGDILAWLEKQGEQKSTLPKWKYKKDNTPLLRDSLILNKYGCVGKSPSGAIVSDVWVLDYDELAKLPKEELEKQCKKKSADNIESKFHVGNWVVINETVYKIIEIDDSHVVLSCNERECSFGLEVLNNAQNFEPKFKVGDWISNGRYVKKIIDINSDWSYYTFQDGLAYRIKEIDTKWYIMPNVDELKWVDMETKECHCYNCELFNRKNNMCKCATLCKEYHNTYKGFYIR